eukprot:m51a1_g9556 hypothetical protein (222) ;mRNA; f:889308-890548
MPMQLCGEPASWAAFHDVLKNAAVVEVSKKPGRKIIPTPSGTGLSVVVEEAKEWFYFKYPKVSQLVQCLSEAVSDSTFSSVMENYASFEQATEAAVTASIWMQELSLLLEDSARKMCAETISTSIQPFLPREFTPSIRDMVKALARQTTQDRVTSLIRQQLELKQRALRFCACDQGHCGLQGCVCRLIAHRKALQSGRRTSKEDDMVVKFGLLVSAQSCVV